MIKYVFENAFHKIEKDNMCVYTHYIYIYIYIYIYTHTKCKTEEK